MTTYYVWKAAMRYWRNTAIQLDLDYWGTQLPPLNFGCEPLKDKLPEELTYRFHPATAPITDLIWSASQYDLYSPRLVTLLDDFGTAYESVPARVRTKGEKDFLTDYRYVHFLCCERGIDWERSDVEVGWNRRGERYARRSRRIVLTEEVESRDIPLFRLYEKSSLVLVNQRFRDEWENRRLTGAHFWTIDEYLSL